tara:strand:- start:21845 stop:22366 length:522 start_codon:yes stop_codon:yes gene_type:complete
MISSGVISLRAAEKEDIKLFHKWSNDQLLVPLIGPTIPTSLNEQEDIFEKNHNDENRKVLMIVKSNETIGYIYLDFDWQNSKVQLSITIGEKVFQNKGIGYYAVMASLNLVFRKYMFNKCYLYVLTSNSRAVKLYEKCGFINEGILREDYQINGSFQDRFAMSILRKDYLIKD